MSIYRIQFVQSGDFYRDNDGEIFETNSKWWAGYVSYHLYQSSGKRTVFVPIRHIKWRVLTNG